MKALKSLYTYVILAVSAFLLSISETRAQESTVPEQRQLARTSSIDFMKMVGVESMFQQNPVATPEMSSLMKHVNWPVNYSSGTLDIKIPIYTIRCGDLELPLYLSYDTSGVKVGNPSGWVGQNWTLVGEPMITVNPKNHLDHNLRCDMEIDHTDVYPYTYALRAIGDNSPFGSIDEQPDEYYFHLADRNGMFLYLMQPNSTEYTYATVPFTNVNIQNQAGHFVITDEKGTSYNFDQHNIYSNNHSANIGWKASSMIAANSIDSIHFDYTSGYGTTQCRHIENYQIVDAFQFDIDSHNTTRPAQNTQIEQLGLEVYTRDDFEPLMKAPIVYHRKDNYVSSYQLDEEDVLQSDHAAWTVPQESLSYSLYSPQFSNISFNGNRLEFTSSGMTLSSIKVRNHLGEIVRTILFDYTSNNGRDYLTSVTFRGHDGKEEKYEFEYQQMLPATDYRRYDFWGYMNSALTTETSLVPRMSITALEDYYHHIAANTYMFDYKEDTLDIGGNDMLSRAAVEQYMLYGTLKSIKYPTGAKDEFLFEANRAYIPYVEGETDFHMTEHLQPVSGQNFVYYVGGLRIRQIKTTGNNGIPFYRTFVYGNGNGAGSTPIEENYNYFVLEQTKHYPYYFFNVQLAYHLYARHRTFSSSPIVPLTYESGQPVLYDKVTEYLGTETDNSGKTEYKFRIPTYRHYYGNEEHFNYFRFRDLEYGQLVEKSSYKRSDGGYTQIEKESYTYSTSTSVGNIVCREYELRDIINLPNESDINTYTTAYSGIAPMIQQSILPVRGNTLMSKEHTVYDDAGRQMKQETTYTYGISALLQPTQETTTLNGTSPYTVNYTYPQDRRSEAPYSDMVAHNMLYEVIGMSQHRGTEYIENFTPFNNQLRPAGTKTRFSNTGSWQDRIEHTYNIHGNRIYSEKDDREKVVYIYGYRHQYVVGIVENASYEEVANAMGGTSYLNTMESRDEPTSSEWNQLNQLRSALPFAHVTTCLYKPLVGMTAMVDPSGLETHFSYDGLGRLTSKSIRNNGVMEVLEEYDYHYYNE